MKKIFTLIIAVIAFSAATNAQCRVDVNNTTLGISPPADSLKAIVRGTAIDTSYVAQVYVPASYSFTYMSIPITATVRWVVIDSVTGFPSNVNYTLYPAGTDTIYGGGRKCISLSGTTLDTIGTYLLNFYGFIRVNTAFTGDTTFTIQQLNSLAGGQGFNYNLRVTQGVGINTISSTLNAALRIYPNPTSGQFDLSLNCGERINGEILVMDITGRRVFAQPIDVTGFYNTVIDLSKFGKGMYTVQVRGENGMAAKTISVE